MRKTSILSALALAALSCAGPDDHHGTDDRRLAAVEVTCPAYDPYCRFDVASDGSATYTVPLEVVPGRAGMEPKLALSYGSNAGNGHLGVGFTIAGLSAISRCGHTLADDNRALGITMSYLDRFCLDGKPLVKVAGQFYGGDGSEYRTLPDTFVKVVSYGRVTGMSDPTYGEKTMVFTPFGELDTAEDALGRVQDTDYDAIGRPVDVRVYDRESGQVLAQTVNTYDVGLPGEPSIGRVISAAFNDVENGTFHTVLERYDASGRTRLVEHRLPGDLPGTTDKLQLQFVWDEFGRLKTATYPALPGESAGGE